MGAELELRVHLLTEEDVEDVLLFERANRDWFERWVPARAPEYFEIEGLRPIVAGLIQDQREGKGRFYLVRDAAGELIGRVNLLWAGATSQGLARMGYRVSGDAAGRGVATRAVALVISDVEANWGIRRLEASTILGNVASERVLERNGFVLVRREPGGLELHGRAVDRLDFARDLGRS